MKSSLDALSSADKQALALFYDTPAFKALEKLAKAEVEALGIDALQSPNHEQTRHLAGKATMVVDLIKMIRVNYKESNKQD